MACGSNATIEAFYDVDETQIQESVGTHFAIVVPLTSESNQSVSCSVDQECNSEVAKLNSVNVENNEMHFNIKAVGEGETALGIVCTGSITENHVYTITIE